MENVCTNKQKELQLQTNRNTTNSPYDYASVMHYSSGAFACPGGETTIMGPTPEARTAINNWMAVPSNCDVYAIHTEYPGPMLPPKAPCSAGVIPYACKPSDYCVAHFGQSDCVTKCQNNCESYSEPIMKGDVYCDILSDDEILSLYFDNGPQYESSGG
eukprot:CAMPEP_0113857296 /NCGR_PEP_ID=MMETSP0372-20130328/10044_1 /TAXON_ID=340204 /ORGANISM="Lankesteria abbotti" /LENGTH=158 /DNA_ID=CAMNT_0000833055 /DNA_START=379 /DNA_END=852 /DNA_ORIENTATION=- /assembly_acc=CAM_ASM_000359